MTRSVGVEIAHMLARNGVDTVFGVPGVHNVELYRGIEEAGLRHVLPRHEQGAGFMADGYARATGRPGVCFVISGPGVTNIMTPLGQAYSDRAPMLVIASCLDETGATKGQLHQMRDQVGAARTVCDWSEEARSPAEALALVARALGEFDKGASRPRAVHVPIAILGAEADEVVSAPSHHVPSVPQEAAIRDLAIRLQDARRPLFVLGGGARGADIAPALRRWNAASMTTYAGRGIVPPGDPLHFGACLARPGSADVVGQADLVITVGTELAEVDLWRADLGVTGVAAHINTDAETLARLARTGATEHILLEGDAARTIHHLDALCSDGHQTDWRATDVADSRRRWRAEVDAEFPGILPAIDAVRDALPANTMIFSDMTRFAYAAKEVWDMDVPGHWHHPYGFGTLGYALPAAVGGALGHDGSVFAIAGDYGFQYTVQELGTASELGLSLPILIWDNGGLGMIEESMVSAQIAPIAINARAPEWDALAAAYRCTCAHPQSLSALAEAVTEAFGAGRPTLIVAGPHLTD